MCKTVNSTVAYDSPTDGRTYYLHINHALLIDEMDANLLCPMQLRLNDVMANDEPKHLVPNPTDNHHAIVLPKMDDEPELIIPLSFWGATHYFATRAPTQEEYDRSDPASHRHLTNANEPWEPHEMGFSAAEQAMLDSAGTLKPTRRKPERTSRIIAKIERDMTSDESLGDALKNHVRISAIYKKATEHSVDAPTLARKWGIGLTKAKDTLLCTTQRLQRSISDNGLTRRFRTNDKQLRYRRLFCTMYTDTMFSDITSWHRKNKCAQVFSTAFGWARAFPMRLKSDAYRAFTTLAQRVGIPPILVADGAREQQMGDFRKETRNCHVRLKQTEPHSPWQNSAEAAIGELKKGAGRKAMKANSPKKLWDHCLELQALIQSHTANSHPDCQGQVPETIVTGQTADISPFIELEWYEWVKFWTRDPYPNDKEVYGRWLGPADDVGPAMTSKILQQNGQVIYVSTYRPLTQEELRKPTEIDMRKLFDKDIGRRIGERTTSDNLESIDPDAVTSHYEYYDDPYDPQFSIPDIDDATPEYNDNYIGAEVTLPLHGEKKSGKVKKRSRTATGDLYGKSSDNPILDTRGYEVEFPDGTVSSYTANVIAENMFTQCDIEGNEHRLMEDIVDHKTDGQEVKTSDMYFVHGNRQHMRKTTKGWHLCVQWKDGSTSWEKLSDMKESYPVEVSEYAFAQDIHEQPAFAWWTKHVLKKRDRIIAAVNKRYHKKTHKFGFEIPKTVRRALEIDKENGNTLWWDAIEKEMINVRIAFKTVTKEEIPIGYQFMESHMIFDVKMEANFRRKARLVANGNNIDTPSYISTYASVVSRETVRIALTLAALNDLQVKSSDIQNAYLTSPCAESVYTILGPEFGPDEGKYAIITRALYGLNSAGSSFGKHLADCMRTLGYVPCKADPDLWMKPAIRPDDGFEYYSYILFYVDDCLAINHDADQCLKDIDKFFPMKPGSIGDPDIYLGAKLRQVKLSNGVNAWSFSPTKYVQEAVGNVEKFIDKNMDGLKLTNRVSGPWPTDYRPELDETEVLNDEMTNYYQSLIGSLHWMLELGRVDLITEISLLAGQMAMPREGHMLAALHVFAYLKKKQNSRMVFDPTYPEIDQSLFEHHDWERYYGDVKEAIPLDAPKPRGKCVDIRMHVDADHAGDKKTRRSRTGFMIYLNSALVIFKSKRQATVETSVFGAEFVAMKQGVETLRGLRYKLRMMGVPISGPSYIYGDNMSVVKNTTKPESTLNKKSNQLCYHAVRESVAMGESLVTHISTHSNSADIATKIIPGGLKRSRMVDGLLYDIESNSKYEELNSTPTA